MVKFYLRENMKLFKRFLLLALFFVPCVSGANVATTAGSNLTAWNGNSGATNNNNWNTLMNNRTLASGGAAPTADFGNCNSLIMRCAQPKCAACTSLEIAKPIVEGCVNSNKDCKKYGDDLVQFMAAQLVSNANAKLQEKQLAAQQAAAQAAATQNSQQIQQMQLQMQEMQAQMQAQNAQQMASMQAALDEQKELVAQAQAQAAAAQQAKLEAETAPGVTVAQQVAIDSGVSEDVLVRQQVSGQILSAIENAEVQLKTLKATMDKVFQYAGCDARGNNCTGPKRVKIFKEKALDFFEPYDAIADEMYDALDTALAVGVDVSDVIMMLNGTCNKWAKYMCYGDDGTEAHKPVQYGADCVHGKSVTNGTYSRGNQECRPTQIIPPQDDIRCTFLDFVTDENEDDTVERHWISEVEGDRFIRVGCATSALESISVIGRRKSNKNRTVDLDTLERIILQDAPEYAGTNRYTGGGDEYGYEKTKYCALTPRGYERLRNAVAQKKLPTSKICVAYDDLLRSISTDGVIDYGDYAFRNNCSKYIKVFSSDACTKINDWSSDVKVDWVCENDSATCDNKVCKITTDGYCWNGEKFVEEEDQIDRALNYIATRRRCDNARGEFRDGTCYCGKVVMTDFTKMCMGGIIQDSVKGEVVGLKVDESMKEKVIQLKDLLQQKK